MHPLAWPERENQGVLPKQFALAKAELKTPTIQFFANAKVRKR
jgi:hypothetical protein